MRKPHFKMFIVLAGISTSHCRSRFAYPQIYFTLLPTTWVCHICRLLAHRAIFARYELDLSAFYSEPKPDAAVNLQGFLLSTHTTTSNQNADHNLEKVLLHHIRRVVLAPQIRYNEGALLDNLRSIIAILVKDAMLTSSLTKPALFLSVRDPHAPSQISPRYKRHHSLQACMTSAHRQLWTSSRAKSPSSTSKHSRLCATILWLSSPRISWMCCSSPDCSSPPILRRLQYPCRNRRTRHTRATRAGSCAPAEPHPIYHHPIHSQTLSVTERILPAAHGWFHLKVPRGHISAAWRDGRRSGCDVQSRRLIQQLQSARTSGIPCVHILELLHRLLS